MAAKSERLLELLQKALKIPPRPDSPAGSRGTTRIFRAARGFFRLRLIEWGLAQAGALAGIVAGLTASSYIPDSIHRLVGVFVIFGETVAVGFFIVQFFLSLVAVHLGYRLRWYIVTDRSLRIREGIWRVREQTVSFANVQNVSVRQGPLQRWFGIADLEIRTAGGGESSDDGTDGDDLHRAVFRGVDNADEIGEIIRRDLRRLRQDEEPDDAAGDEATGDSLLEAARELADEAAALRAAIALRH